jgi:hypothetical protein
MNNDAGTPLPATSPITKQAVFAEQEEVVEVSPNLPRRMDQGVQVELGPLRKRREIFGRMLI